MKNSKRGFVPIVLLIIVVAAAIGGGTYYYSQKTPNTEVKTNNQATTTDQTASWKTYKNDKYGFQFNYPKGLTRLQEYPDAQDCKLTATGKGSYGYPPTVATISNVTVSVLCAELAGNSPSLPPKNTNATKTVITIGGVSACQYEFVTATGYEWRVVQIPILNAGKYIELAYTYGNSYRLNGNGYELNNKEWADILASFKITDNKSNQVDISISQIKDEGNDGLVLMYPNNKESWVLGIRSNMSNPYVIQWTPNNKKKVKLFLETLDPKTGIYKDVGELYPDQNQYFDNSIKWLGGVNEIDLFPKKGSYFIKIVEEDTGRWDRSDNSINLFPEGSAEIIMLLNNQPTLASKPLMIDKEGQEIEVRWASDKTKNCKLSYGSKNSYLSEDVNSVGYKKIFVGFIDFSLYNSVILKCDIVGGTEGSGAVSAFGFYSSTWKNNEYIKIKQGFEKEAFVKDNTTVSTPGFTIESNAGIEYLRKVSVSVNDMNKLKAFEKVSLYVDDELIQTVKIDPSNLDGFDPVIFDAAKMRGYFVPITSGSIIDFEFTPKSSTSLLYRGESVGIMSMSVDGLLKDGMTFYSRLDLSPHYQINFR